jgi:hypothetical protein
MNGCLPKNLCLLYKPVYWCITLNLFSHDHNFKDMFQMLNKPWSSKSKLPGYSNKPRSSKCMEMYGYVWNLKMIKSKYFLMNHSSACLSLCHRILNAKRIWIQWMTGDGKSSLYSFWSGTVKIIMNNKNTQPNLQPKICKTPVVA